MYRGDEERERGEGRRKETVLGRRGTDDKEEGRKRERTVSPVVVKVGRKVPTSPTRGVSQWVTPPIPCDFRFAKKDSVSSMGVFHGKGVSVFLTRSTLPLSTYQMSSCSQSLT